MGKPSTKQAVQAISVLGNNADFDAVESSVLQAIINDPVTSGREFTRFLQNRARVYVVSNHIIDLDADPFVPEGWKIEDHRRGGQLTWSPDAVALHLSERQKNGGYIEGHKLRKEMAKRAVFNACLLDYLLAHPELILEEWKGKYVFFWGTIYRNSNGDLFVRYLGWFGERWYWALQLPRRRVE